MKVHWFRTLLQASLVSLLVPFVLPAATPMECSVRKQLSASAARDEAAKANQLFDQFEYNDWALITVSDKLAVHSSLRNNLSPQSHAALLNQATDDINQMSTILCRLETMKASVDPWQARLIDRMHDDTVLSAVHVEGAIRYLNNNHERVRVGLAPIYHQQLETVYEKARDLNEKVNAYRALESASARVKAIEARTAG